MAHILILPPELLNIIFNLLDPVTSTCLGLAAKHLYPIHRSFHGTVSLKTPNSCMTHSLEQLIETWIGGGRPYNGGLEFIYSTFSNKFMYMEDIVATHIREMDRLKKMETSRNAEKKYITQALRKGARKGLGLKGSSRRLQQRLTAVEIRKGEIEPLRRALRGHLSEARIAIRKKAKKFGVLHRDGIYRTSRERYLTEEDDEMGGDDRDFVLVLGDI